MGMQRIGEFCGSSLGNDQGIRQAAAALGQALAQSRIWSSVEGTSD